jgi:hypothetical protein
MEAVRSSETLKNFYQTVRCHTPKYSNVRNHGFDNLISHTKPTASHISVSPAFALTAPAMLAPADRVTPRGKVVLVREEIDLLGEGGGQGKRNYSLL